MSALHWPRGSRIRAVVTLLLAALGAASLAGLPAAAQEVPGARAETEAAAEPEPVSPDAIAARSTALAEELDANEAARAEARSKAERMHLEAVRDGLRAVEALLRQQAELAGPEGAAVSDPWLPPEAEAPSLLALDRLYEAQLAFEREEQRREEALAASREALAAAKEKFSLAEKKRREARATLEEAEGVGERARAERELRIRQLVSRTAEERVHLRTLETRFAARAQEEAPADSELTARIADMRTALAQERGAADDVFATVTAREGELRRTREALVRKLSTTELRLEAAQQRFSRQAEPSAELLEEVEARTAERDAIRQEVELIDAQLERLSAQRATWRQWDATLRGRATREELESWKVSLTERLEELEQAELIRRGQAADLERRIDALQARLRSLPDRAPVRSVLEEKLAMLARLLDAERGEVAELAHDRRLSSRLQEELRRRTGELDPLDLAVRGLRSARDLWSYEITAVDDSAITVGSLVLALLLAALGLWASRFGSALLGRFAMDRFRLDAGAAHAIETLSFYLLLVGFTLLALRAVHFPLTAFTVLGGALAIGIGFGSQNVMNNFISGLILMLERPVRARDIVEVDGNHGTVERIGARSTLIRSTDGRHIIVPNSFFLENNVVNWTLSDDLIRSSVTVGVIYGSPTRLVEELIHRVVSEEDSVLHEPQPVILFEGFGDDSLDFEAHFWVRARSPMERRVVQSRVRFRIDELFREHGLVIAFPQRDVHLDSASPIEVRVMDGAGASEPRADD